MGCARCGRRQVDPDSGPSAWRRAVVAGEQVLVCPECQVEAWTDGLDSCPGCGSTRLVKQLGDVVCRACGRTSAPQRREPPPSGRPAAAARLADDVSLAVERVLRPD